MSGEEHWDYIVVGGGSAGCVLANRLSADPALRVLLLDAGRPDNHLFTRVPAGQMPAFPRPDMNWLYEAQPDASLNHRVLPWPAGKVLGGGSAINGMMFVRGHPSDYDGWAALGCPGWDYAGVLPYFKRLETNEGGGNAHRGGDGPLSVASVRVEHPLNHAFVQAAVNAGIPFNADLNGASPEGVGYCQATQKSGWRHSTAQAYIRPVRTRANLCVMNLCRVDQILFEGSRAVGAAMMRSGLQAEVRARRGVIVCAGAIATPKLLLLSGIGASDALHSHGVSVRHELRGVGRNLQEHAVAPVGVELHGIGTLTSELGILSALKHGIDYMLRGRGALSTSIGHVHALARTQPDLAAPDAQIIFAPMSYEMGPSGPRPDRRPRMSFGVGLCRTNSFGELRLRSSDPRAAPVIDYQLLGSREDVRHLTEACRLARRILHTQPLAQYCGDEFEPGESVQNDEQWERFLRATAGLMYHPCGTCRMGEDADAVVDPQLRVRGLDALWVADASIIPRIPAGNINATCIMIGEKAADLVRAQN